MYQIYSIKELLSQSLELDFVLIQGWIRTQRVTKSGLSFIHIYDGSSPKTLQVIAEKTLDKYEDIKKLSTGCSVKIYGKLIKSLGKEQDYELKAERIDIIGLVEDPITYPMQKKEHSPEHLRKHAHLRSRTATFSSVMRLRHYLAMGIHKFFSDKGFYWIHTPLITSADCEGAGQVFGISQGREFFGKDVGLTVSGQLTLEPFATSMSKVYTFGPTFRAEDSHTSRHLSEFWMIEPEIAFADLDYIVQISEEFVKELFKVSLEKGFDDLKLLEKEYKRSDLISRLEKYVGQDFQVITYTDAIKILERSGRAFEYPVSWGLDLQAEHEKYLCKHFDKPLIVREYPKEIKAFYMYESENKRTVKSMDLLLPEIGELIGGSQREDRYDVLLDKIRTLKLKEEEYSWYLDLRKYGTVPHSGFGLGFERAIQYISGTPSIRDTIPYPRFPGSIDF